MQETKAVGAIDYRRRHVIGAAAMSFAIGELGLGAPVMAASSLTNEATTVVSSVGSFSALKEIEAGVLNIGYAELGPIDGPPVILLHGWPYDIHMYVDVAPILAAKGHLVIVPYLRGYGTTRFLSNEAPRNGQQSALGADVIALMDALGIERATIGGCDWAPARQTSSPRFGRNAARR